MFATCKQQIKAACLGPQSLPSDAGTHWMHFTVSLFIIITPFLLSCGTEPAAPISAGRIQLPATCFSRMLGVQCPGCGATHAFVKIAEGNIRESIRWHRVGVLLYGYFLIQVVFRAYLLRMPQQRKNPNLAVFQHWLSMTMIVLLMVNWALAMVLGGNGS